MKLKTLAIAIALGAMPFAAQADFKVTGDFSVGYFGDADGTKELREQGEMGEWGPLGFDNSVVSLNLARGNRGGADFDTLRKEFWKS